MAIVLQRQHTILFGEEPRKDADGWITRRMVLKPCGCWVAEVWRKAEAPAGITAIAPPGVNPLPEGWALQTLECRVHSAIVVIGSLELAERLNGAASLASIVDGAKRLLADRESYRARALEMNAALAACASLPPKRVEELDDDEQAAIGWLPLDDKRLLPPGAETREALPYNAAAFGAVHAAIGSGSAMLPPAAPPAPALPPKTTKRKRTRGRR